MGFGLPGFLSRLKDVPAATASKFLRRNAGDTAFEWAEAGGAASHPAINDFRLTLASGIPVTVSDVIGATTIYCTPCIGTQIALYDGSAWNIRTSSEFSIALGTLTSGRPYDVFCYDNAGTPTLEMLAWTNDTTRATGLSTQDGVLVKSGAATRRYLGTFYTTATTTTEDSVTSRYLWNYYNRSPRVMYREETTSAWNYTTAVFRQANNNIANQLNFVIGVNDSAVSVQLHCRRASATTGNTIAGIGLDSTTATINYTGSRGYLPTFVSGLYNTSEAWYQGNIAIGRHYFSWLEYSDTGGTTTWAGTVSAIGGVILA